MASTLLTLLPLIILVDFFWHTPCAFLGMPIMLGRSSLEKLTECHIVLLKPT